MVQAQVQTASVNENARYQDFVKLTALTEGPASGVRKIWLLAMVTLVNLLVWSESLRLLKNTSSFT